MTVKERITALREVMAEKKIDAYLVPTDDFHASEYVGEYFKCRKYITGFTGSAGRAVIMQDMAGLWTDGRYFIQATAQDVYKRQYSGSTPCSNQGKSSVHQLLRRIPYISRDPED